MQSQEKKKVSNIKKSVAIGTSQTTKVFKNINKEEGRRLSLELMKL
jgi:hypothetical protein